MPIKAETPAAAAHPDHSQCCDTPAYCSSVRRCTAKDAQPSPRASFEKWARDEGYSDEALEHDGFGYKGPDLTSDWLLWIAAWKAAGGTCGD